jgi:hypothetical protein
MIGLLGVVFLTLMSRRPHEPDTASRLELVPADDGLQHVLDVAARAAEVLVQGVLGATAARPTARASPARDPMSRENTAKASETR